jgi:hypothetical protein
MKMIDRQRKEDIKSRIQLLSDELTPLLARAESLRQRIYALQLDLAEVLDGRFQRREFQTKKFEEVREVR